MNPVSSRLLNQQLAAPQFTDPVDVVSHLGAIQAQDYRMVRWAVASRTRRPSLKAFTKAFDDGRIIRTHLMRCTWQLVCREDYWWMLDLCSSKALTVMNGWMHSNGIDIPDSEVQQIRELLLDVADQKGSATKEDFVDGLAMKGIVMDDHRLSYHIRLCEFAGVLCSGDLQPQKATYSLSESKVGPRVTMDRDEALMLLARKYFQSRCPATMEDFVWWSGLGVGDCRRAVSLLGDEIHLEKWKDYEFYMMDSSRTRGFRKGDSILMSPYDEYLIGYKSREIVLSLEYRHKAHNNSGIFYPVIASDGIICGNWSPTRPVLQCEFFTDDLAVDLDTQWSRFQDYKRR